MTIAACYLLPEGVVFGCDSTWTIPVKRVNATPDDHYFNHGQKLFEVGNGSTLGMLIWGLNSLPDQSMRTLIATFADELNGKPAKSVEEAAEQWSKFFWDRYTATYADDIKRVKELSDIIAKKKAEGQENDAPNEADEKDDEEEPTEEDELDFLVEEYKGGFCIGGYCLPDRRPAAYEITYDLSQGNPVINPLDYGVPRFWGWGNLIQRLLFGLDVGILNAIQDSEHWTGTVQDLGKLITDKCLVQPTVVPIREAVDWIHASIYTTIKSMKFSHLAPVCGGPIELAVITTDRPFRWVRHKDLDSALIYT